MTRPGRESLLGNRGDGVSSMLVSVGGGNEDLGRPSWHSVFSPRAGWRHTHSVASLCLLCFLYGIGESWGWARLGLPSPPPQALASCTSPCHPAAGWSGTSLQSVQLASPRRTLFLRGLMSHLRGGWEMLVQQVALFPIFTTSNRSPPLASQFICFTSSSPPCAHPCLLHQLPAPLLCPLPLPGLVTQAMAQELVWQSYQAVLSLPCVAVFLISSYTSIFRPPRGKPPGKD